MPVIVTISCNRALHSRPCATPGVATVIDSISGCDRVDLQWAMWLHGVVPIWSCASACVDHASLMQAVMATMIFALRSSRASASDLAGSSDAIKNITIMVICNAPRTLAQSLLSGSKRSTDSVLTDHHPYGILILAHRVIPATG